MSLMSNTQPDLDEILFNKLCQWIEKFKPKHQLEQPFLTRRLYGEIRPTVAGTYNLPLQAGDEQYAGPALGKLWTVQFVTLFGTPNDFSPVGSFTGATVYLGGGDTAGGSSAQVIFPSIGTVTQPGYQDFTDRTVWQYPNENLYLGVTVTGATVAKATAQIKEYNLADIQPKVI